MLAHASFGKLDACHRLRVATAVSAGAGQSYADDRHFAEPLDLEQLAAVAALSTRVGQIVGETPSRFQKRYGGQSPRIPGCYVFMWGLVERKSASEEKPEAGTPA